MRIPFVRFFLTTLAFILWHIVRGSREVLSGRLLKQDAQYTADCIEIWQDYRTANIREE